jgi:hypothetical protein
MPGMSGRRSSTFQCSTMPGEEEGLCLVACPGRGGSACGRRVEWVQVGRSGRRKRPEYRKRDCQSDSLGRTSPERKGSFAWWKLPPDFTLCGPGGCVAGSARSASSRRTSTRSRYHWRRSRPKAGEGGRVSGGEGCQEHRPSPARRTRPVAIRESASRLRMRSQDSPPRRRASRGRCSRRPSAGRERCCGP